MQVAESVKIVESAKNQALKKITNKYLGHHCRSDEEQVTESGYWFLNFSFDRDFYHHLLCEDTGDETIDAKKKAEEMGLDITIDQDQLTVPYTDKNRDAISSFIESVGGKVMKYEMAFERNKPFINKMYIRLKLEEA